MTKHNHDTTRSDGSTDTGDGATNRTTASMCKFRGETDNPTWIGVRGRNTADSGTPIGVLGVVPDGSEGYGLSTPDDVAVGGTTEVSALAGPLTDGSEIATLVGTALAIENGRLTASRPDVGDGSTTVEDTETIEFGSGISVADTGDGAVEIDR